LAANMDENNKKNTKPPFNIAALIVQLSVMLFVMLGLFYLSNFIDLPQGLLSAFLLFIFLVYFSLRYYNKLHRPKRVFIIGLTISAFILTILFAYKYYVSDIEINIIYIGILLVLPVLLMQHLEKREKEDPNRTRT
jgi:peptidoglycan biosynthesis protein MviN/MurJ (putative lipid II flippase)